METIEVEKIASRGLEIGKALVFRKEEPEISDMLISSEQEQAEISAVLKAIELSRKQIEYIILSATKKAGGKEAEIFSAHLDILDDKTLMQGIEDKIKSGHKNAELALHETAEEISAMFEALDDEYIKQRVSDIKDVCRRIFDNMQGKDPDALRNIEEKTILVANELAPSDTAMMDIEKVCGFITETGGSTSHAVIMAKSMEMRLL